VFSNHEAKLTLGWDCSQINITTRSQKVPSTMQIDTLFILGVFVPTFLGLSFYVNPDWFWNPEYGLFKSFSFIRVTHIASNHLDPITQLTFILCRSSMLFIGFMSWFANNAMAKKHALHMLCSARTCFVFSPFSRPPKANPSTSTKPRLLSLPQYF
jgi:hypothetical protein